MNREVSEIDDDPEEEKDTIYDLAAIKRENLDFPIRVIELRFKTGPTDINYQKYIFAEDLRIIYWEPRLSAMKMSFSMLPGNWERKVKFVYQDKNGDIVMTNKHTTRTSVLVPFYTVESQKEYGMIPDLKYHFVEVTDIERPGPAAVMLNRYLDERRDKLSKMRKEKLRQKQVQGKKPLVTVRKQKFEGTLKELKIKTKEVADDLGVDVPKQATNKYTRSRAEEEMGKLDEEFDELAKKLRMTFLLRERMRLLVE